MARYGKVLSNFNFKHLTDAQVVSCKVCHRHAVRNTHTNKSHVLVPCTQETEHRTHIALFALRYFVQHCLSNTRRVEATFLLNFVPPKHPAWWHSLLSVDEQREEIKERERQGKVSSTFAAIRFSLVLPLKNALAILIHNSSDVISSVNKLGVCTPQTFS